MRLDLQFFGGRGSGSSASDSYKDITGSQENMVKYMNEGSTAINGNLSKTEVDALSKYHYGNAVTLNNALRDGESTGGGFTQSDLNSIDSAISKGSLKENTTLYRGVPKEFAGVDFSDPKSAVGKTFTDKGYSSFTVSKDVANEYSHGTVFKLDAKKGTHTAFVDGAIHSKSDLREFAKEGDAGNFECLLKRGQQYKITGYSKSGKNTVYNIEMVGR